MTNRTRVLRVAGMSAESEDGGDGRDEDGERGDREKDSDGSDSRSKKEKNCPPEEHRFKPGQSGNPKGRPKLRKSLRTLVAEAIYETITVQTKNGSRKMTALAALIRKNLHLGLAGDRKGMQNTLDLMRASNLLEAEKAVDPAKNELSADDAAVLQEYLNRHTRKDDE